jgi:hypothetical protein
VPKINVVFYAEDARSPVLDWLELQPNKVQDKFDFLIGLLAMSGHELRRPHSAPLERKIHELRARHQQVNYRLLYFFDGQTAAVLAHGCTKEDVVPTIDIDRAVVRMKKYLTDPAAHVYRSPEK